MEFKFKHQQTDLERLEDMAVAAMETGNAGRAREVLAEHKEAFPAECAAVRTTILRDYGVRL